MKVKCSVPNYNFNIKRGMLARGRAGQKIEKLSTYRGLATGSSRTGLLDKRFVLILGFFNVKLKHEAVDFPFFLVVV